MFKMTSQHLEMFYDVLILEPQSRDVRLLLEALARRNARGTVVSGTEGAVALAERQRWHLAFVSSRFPMGDSGMAAQTLWSALRRNNPEMPVVMVCEPQDAQTISAALRSGCVAALQKPLTDAAVAELLDRFLPCRTLSIAAIAPTCDGRWHPLIGKSAALANAVAKARAAAPTSLPVLITGESGTGKELLAGLIHSHSKRADGPMVYLNCAALNESLLESELFGHEKGAFTGALMAHRGRLERADGGTLLLDEITETPPAFQAKLLRALEQMQFERVGGKEPIRVNVRLISTTNRDLRQAVAEGRFRADLYYRLSALTIQMPPLRQRREDIIDLVWWFIGEFTSQTQRVITAIEPATLTALQAHYWPGNIRQLRNVIGSMMIFGAGEVLTFRDSPDILDAFAEPAMTAQTSPLAADEWTAECSSLEDLEKRAILAALRRCGGNRTQAARQLGISDRTLRDKVKKYASDSALCAG